jgi:hypothetical protein
MQAGTSHARPTSPHSGPATDCTGWPPAGRTGGHPRRTRAHRLHRQHHRSGLRWRVPAPAAPDHRRRWARRR